MTSFKEFISESYKNLFTAADKLKYADEAYAQIIDAYRPIGGIHGSGFESVEDFIESIPFWKLNVKNKKILAASYYKDKAGRKRIAVSSNGTKEGKQALAKMMIDDLIQERSYGEVSGPSLSFLAKNVGYDVIKKYAIPMEEVSRVLKVRIRPAEKDDPEVVNHPLLKDYFYQRYIGGELLTKIALGTPRKKIY